ncbi:MAG TPA: hypothetical protein PKL97_00025 [Candidatus Omnitrophota bacterium]|nr:hypothetical protein [Candidatus Omnitrophota bacterium]
MGESYLLLQFLALSLYAFFAGFCFCDGFGLPLSRKLIWFLLFAALSIYVLKRTGEFNLTFILPVPTLLAIFFCALQKRKTAAKGK